MRAGSPYTRSEELCGETPPLGLRPGGHSGASAGADRQRTLSAELELAHGPAGAWFRDAKLGIYNHWGPVTYATVQQSESGIQVSVPAARRHAIDTIVRLELDGPASTLPILCEG
jgi:hypothetical protein